MVQVNNPASHFPLLLDEVGLHLLLSQVSYCLKYRLLDVPEPSLVLSHLIKAVVGFLLQDNRSLQVSITCPFKRIFRLVLCRVFRVDLPDPME